jgi:hypothetical protein
VILNLNQGCSEIVSSDPYRANLRVLYRRVIAQCYVESAVGYVVVTTVLNANAVLPMYNKSSAEMSDEKVEIARRFSL